MTARDYFEGILMLESRLRLARERLDQIEERIDGLGGSGQHGGSGDPSWRIASSVEAMRTARERWASALDGLCDSEDEAVGVIWSIAYPNGHTLALWRRCLWARYLKGMSYREIAELTGKSEKAVEHAIARALEAVDSQGLVSKL